MSKCIPNVDDFCAFLHYRWKAPNKIEFLLMDRPVSFYFYMHKNRKKNNILSMNVINCKSANCKSADKVRVHACVRADIFRNKYKAYSFKSILEDTCLSAKKNACSDMIAKLTVYLLYIQKSIISVIYAHYTTIFLCVIFFENKAIR